MDPLHMHMLLNHVPVIGGVAALLLLAWGLLRCSIQVTLAALIGLVIVGLVAIPVFLTGSIGEERFETLPQLSRELVQRHQDAAVAATVGLISAAAIAVAALIGWRSTRKLPRFAATAALIIGTAALVLAVRTATLGGQIRQNDLQGLNTMSSPLPEPLAATRPR
jgi:uncharacterized membrane protein